MTTSPNASKKVPQPVAGVYSGGNIVAFSVVFDGIVEFCVGTDGVVVSKVVEFDGVCAGMADEFVGTGVGVTVDIVSLDEEFVLLGTGIVVTAEEFSGLSVTLALIIGGSVGLTVVYWIKRFKANEFRIIFPVLFVLPIVPFILGSTLVTFCPKVKSHPAIRITTTIKLRYFIISSNLIPLLTLYDAN